MPFNYTEFEYQCGNPLYYRYATIPMGQAPVHEFHVDIYEMDDEVGVLSSNTDEDTRFCNDGSGAYKYYDTEMTTITTGGDLNSATCNDVVCHGRVQIHLSSAVVTKQTSRHGTSAIQIFSDEGGLLGGILFLTWFFSIFII